MDMLGGMDAFGYELERLLMLDGARRAWSKLVPHTWRPIMGNQKGVNEHWRMWQEGRMVNST